MTNNFLQQPYYGLPFQFPPQQMQQPAPVPPPDAPGGFPDMQQHAPAPNAFYIPGLQHAPASNTNQNSYNQNAQQPPSPQVAAWPPSDPNAWFALMHSAALNGQPPPPLPGFAFPPQHFPQAPPLPATPMPFPPQPAQHTSAASGCIEEVMDSDREDGEVSEREVAPQPLAGKANGRAFPEPPRSVPQAKHASPRVEEAYNPDRPAAGQMAVKGTVQKALQQAAAQVDPLQPQRDLAKQFVKLLHSNNVGYRALASENIDLEQLRGLYQSLNLPSEPAPILPLKSNVAPPASLAVQPMSSGQVEQQKPMPTVKTNINAVPPPKSAPSPIDRKDYIARLQAAKLAKQSGAAKPSPPQKTPPAPAASVAPAVNTPQAVATPTAKPPITDEQRARNTELIKQRLEALKAKNQVAPSLHGTASAPSAAQKIEQVQPAMEQAASSNTGTPNNQAYAPAFPGIPGLFMNPPPAFDIGNSKPTPSIPQKRPAPSDTTELSTPRGSVTPYTRPLGDSPHAYNDEPMIIEVSDDGSNSSDMDIDNEAPSKSVVTSYANQQRRLPGNVPEFPSWPTSTFPGSSAVSTPGPQTPTTEAREQELKKKQDELAAMKRRLQKKLAEKREKDREAAAAALSLQSDIANGANELIRDVKRRRQEEIQSKLPSFDTELASNSSRINQLMKEMEELRSQNEKITKNKERLILELESLGVDTDGMSHAEMRAKKDEIEHEMSPEPEVTTEAADISQQETANASIDASVAVPVEHAQDVQEIGAAPGLVKLQAESEGTNQHVTLPGFGSSSQQFVQDTMAPFQASTVDEVQLTEAGPTMSSEPQLSISQERLQLQGTPTPMESFTTSIIDAAATAVQDSATPFDEDDFYSPAPAVEPELDASIAVANTIPTGSAADPIAALSPSEEGEVEMSVSSEDEEEEYEPEEPTVRVDIPVQEVQLPDLAAAKSLASEDVSTEDEEAYEPPDVDEELPNEQAVNQDVAVDIESTAPLAEAEDGAMDLASSSEEESDSDSDGEIFSEPENDETISESHALQGTIDIADDLAPGMQQESAVEAVPVADEEPEVVKFTPYESPLRMFKSYRYHPNFAQDVPGGFLSTTFSHQIDPEKPMCQYETAGGSCNDPECPDQHFRGMGITGETLLVQLGTANPGKTTEEKQQWNDGLRGVLKELRKKSIKDPNGIAVEIAKYRRQFLNDDTRVVNF